MPRKKFKDFVPRPKPRKRPGRHKKRLSKSEKRQFTLYVGRMDSNENSKFLNLFHLLDKMSNIK